MKRSAICVPVLTVGLLSGCGGRDGGGSASAPETTPYAGFGYTDVLYRGTLTATKANGVSVSNPVGVSVSLEGTVSSEGSRLIAHGQGAVDPTGQTFTPFYRLLVGPTSALLDAPLPNLTQYNGTATIVTGSQGLTAKFVDPVTGAKATLQATADNPNLTPVKPPAGTYEGMDYGRGSLSGTLYFAGPATGTVASDGTFTFRYTASGSSSSGELRGRFSENGTASDVIIIRGANVVSLMEQTVTAYGTGNDLTVVLRSPVSNMVGETYRLKRVGD